MENDRISTLRNWPTPTMVKEVQRFLGFANYYRRFILGFGQVAAPITSLLKGDQCDCNGQLGRTGLLVT
jgi:hypothetical protein